MNRVPGFSATVLTRSPDGSSIRPSGVTHSTENPSGGRRKTLAWTRSISGPSMRISLDASRPMDRPSST